MLAKILFALILFCSPALASYETIAKKQVAPPAAACLTPDAFTKAAPAQLKFKQKLDGDELKNFKKNVSEILDTSLPNDADTILLFEASPEITIFAVFVKGCIDGFGRVDSDHLPKLLREDDSI